RLNDFIREWTAHGSQLSAKVEVIYNLFIVLSVDEKVAQVTGCSIDKSVHMLKEIERTIQIDLFNRLFISYRDDQGDVQIVSRDVFEALCQQGVVNQDTIVFNNMIQTPDDLASKWEVPLKDSWHHQFFGKK
ncbi:MAG: ABC transporter ATPase, partial [Sphingobacterium sp.]